jgi:hypothetical protein
MPNDGKWDVLSEHAATLAMHAALLSTGQILFFGGNERREEQHAAGPSGWDHTRIWTPENGNVDYVPSPDFDVFCCGHCFLGSGQLLVVGGTEAWFDKAGPIHAPHGHMPGVRNATRLSPRRVGVVDQLWHNAQTGTGLGVAWTDWDLFTRPANKARQIYVLRHFDGRLHAFVIGMDDQVWHNDQTGTGLGSAWTGWNYLSNAGDKARSVTVVANADGRLHAFMIGMDDQVWHNDQTGTGLGSAWTGWNYLSSRYDEAKDLAIANDGAGRVHAFAVGMRRFPWIATPQLLPERGNPAGGGRWYPTPLTLGDGRIVVMGGHPDKADNRHSNFMVELFDQVQNQWSDVGDEPQSVITAVSNRPDQKPEIYPRMHLLPDGKVFCVALADEQSWLWGQASGFAAMGAAIPPSMLLSLNYDQNLWGSVLLPLRPSDGYNARVLVAGGVSQPYVISPNAPKPMWTPTQPRQGFLGPPPIRNFASLVLLPDGMVLMVGGTSGNPKDDKQFGVREAEQYDPVNGTWTRLAAATVTRQYHSTALLLPDGRVWTGGSNPNDGTAREERMEIFSPPYLFRGSRPTIDFAPTNLVRDTTFSIRSQNVEDIASVVMIRCGSATHGFDADQRLVELGIQSRSRPESTLVVKAPPNNNVAPPGYYILFVLNANKVPSRGRMVHL